VFAEGGIPLNVEHLAEQLRRDLWRVGVRRPQLHESTKGHQRIRAHDLRATLVTISPATGKSETWISDRTGHRFHEMIETYRRRSRTRNLGDLGPLCELIRELQKASDWAANGQRHHRTGGEIGRRSGFRFRADGGRFSGDRENKPDRRSEETRKRGPSPGQGAIEGQSGDPGYPGRPGRTRAGEGSGEGSRRGQV
jgi:hypothetical protein